MSEYEECPKCGLKFSLCAGHTSLADEFRYKLYELRSAYCELRGDIFGIGAAK